VNEQTEDRHTRGVFLLDHALYVDATTAINCSSCVLHVHSLSGSGGTMHRLKLDVSIPYTSSCVTDAEAVGRCVDRKVTSLRLGSRMNEES
jgi:hypothetical protein